MHKLSEAMITALNYYATQERITDPGRVFGGSPVTGTVVALIDRELVTYGRDHVLTDAGRAAHRELFAWVDDATYGGAHYVRLAVAPRSAEFIDAAPWVDALRAREVATAEREAYAEESARVEHEEESTRVRLAAIAALDYVTAEFTDDAFLGSGALDYSWYQQIIIDEETDTNWTLTFSDLDSEPVKGEQARYTVTHKTVLEAVAMIATEQKDASEDCRDNCQLMIDGLLVEVDFDSDTADQVLQVAAFGEIIYG